MRRALLVAIPVVAVAFAAPTRAAGPAERCASSAEHGQSLRKHGKLLDARAAMHDCSRAACPRVVRDDCTTWEAQLEAAIPTLAVAVKDARGDDVTDAAILVDGRPLDEAARGLAVELDPGEHVVRV